MHNAHNVPVYKKKNLHFISFFFFLEKKPNPYIPGSFLAKTKLLSSPSILASNFEKSVLQISDWLNLEQDILKKQNICILDTDAIQLAIQKQKVWLLTDYRIFRKTL